MVKATNQAILQLMAWGYGYSPQALEHGLVEVEDVDLLNGGESVVHGMVQAYQEWMGPMINLRASAPAEEGGLGRAIIPDGEPGEFTIHEIMYGERCGFPDYPHPERGYVTFDFECPEAGELWLGSAEESNWPNACRQEITASYEMSLPGLTDEQLLALTLEGSKHWMDNFQVKIIQRNDSYPNTNRYSFKANLGGSVLADQYLAVNNCSARLRGRYDNRNWSPELFVATHTHEEGHFWGCPHSNNSDATMYAAITQASMRRRGALHPADKAIMRGLGYQVRTTPIPDPQPPEPPGDRPIFDGVLRIRGTEFEYLLVPKASV